MSLDSFQQRVLEEFFERQSDFFLTGGGALAGFHLKHRRTKDLDLFTTEDALEQGVAALHDMAGDLDASIESLRTAATFRRFLLRRGSDSAIVDLVHDLAPQIYPEKLLIGAIRVDPPEEILANKLCALLSRAEIRDLVDIYTLAQHGFSVEQAVSEASRKDGGMSPGQLAWILSEIELGDDAQPPGVSIEELRAFLEEFQKKMSELAFPE